MENVFTNNIYLISINNITNFAYIYITLAWRVVKTLSSPSWWISACNWAAGIALSFASALNFAVSLPSLKASAHIYKQDRIL